MYLSLRTNALSLPARLLCVTCPSILPPPPPPPINFIPGETSFGGESQLGLRKGDRACLARCSAYSFAIQHGDFGFGSASYCSRSQPHVQPSFLRPSFPLPCLSLSMSLSHALISFPLPPPSPSLSLPQMNILRIYLCRRQGKVRTAAAAGGEGHSSRLLTIRSRFGWVKGAASRRQLPGHAWPCIVITSRSRSRSSVERDAL